MAATVNRESPGVDLATCKWCESPMRKTASRCARCRNYRNDIHQERFVVYAMAGIAVGLALTGFSQGWWTETVFDGFSRSRFVTTTSGWLVMGLGAISLAFYTRVSRKLESWLWL